MNSTTVYSFPSLLVSLGFLLAAVPGGAQHVVDLGDENTIPKYCQQDMSWCGAATAQMILEGYPGGVEHDGNDQGFIDSRIQFHSDDPNAYPGWATEPHGLEKTLMELGPGPDVNWVALGNPDEDALMWEIAYWMTTRRYPVAVLVNKGSSPCNVFAHWVLITAVTTDLDPVAHSTVQLQQVTIYDPFAFDSGVCIDGDPGIDLTEITVTSAGWFANYWCAPGQMSNSKWDGNFVAVIEPPRTQGVVERTRIVQQGELIDAGAAHDHARKWVAEMDLFATGKYSLLRKTSPLQPMLTNAADRAYYVVPYGHRDGSSSHAALILNAYDGALLEVGLFPHPIKYLQEDEAARVALDYLGLRRATTKAALIFGPWEEAHSRYLPLWEVNVERNRWILPDSTHTVYVSQKGEVFTQLTTPDKMGE